MNSIKRKNELELLAPAGSFDTLKAVIAAGADAVYLGGISFGARAYAKNFQEEELLAAIDYGHIRNRKIILTVNTLFKNEEIEEQLYSYLLPYYKAGIDGVIVQDFGVLSFVRKNFPGLPIHASTQMTITGAAGAGFLKEQGVSRIVTARELSLAEIRKIADEVDIEIESFIHGALCYCYSGQCLLSSVIGGRSGNRGRCAQPCRLPYTVLDKQGRSLNTKNPYILSLKDLNTIEFLPEIAESGVYSFKIEGRMKSTAYAAGVVSVYRYYMDMYLREGKEKYHVSSEDERKLYDFGNRSGFTKGYYYDRNSADMITGRASNHSKTDCKETQEQKGSGEIKEKIYGKLILRNDSDAIIEVCDQTYHVTVTGAPPQKAKKHPMNRDDVLAKINKTGNTPFVFEQVELCMDDDIFLPVASLNHLRKEALDLLAKERLKPYRRTAPAKAVPQRWAPDEAGGRKEPELIVSTECRDGLLAALAENAVDEIYLDSVMYRRDQLLSDLKTDIKKCTDAGKRVFFILPAVFRMDTAEFYEKIANEFFSLPLNGVIARGYDTLSYAMSHLREEMELRIDYSLYTYSDTAKTAFFEAAGVKRDTVPFELNKRELSCRNNTGSEFLIYGYLPLMISAGCVNKNTKGCDKQSRVLRLRDRYGIEFKVRNYCSECYNILYNSKPLFLFHHERELSRLNIHSYRIHFTMEQRSEAEAVLEAYKRAFLENKEIDPKDYLPDYTNGHYKRGVE